MAAVFLPSVCCFAQSPITDQYSPITVPTAVEVSTYLATAVP